MITPYVSQSLPLDQLKDAPTAAAYGLRRLKSGYKGNACIVRRSNDNAELAIPFCGQDLCLSTLRAFVTTNSGFITTWYDQSGNGLNATQTTAANQPRIVNAGVVDESPLFTRASSHALNVADNAAFKATSNLTLVTISKSNETTNGLGIAGYKDGSEYKYMNYKGSTGQSYSGYGRTASFSTPATSGANNPSFVNSKILISTTYDKTLSSSRLKLYANGTLGTPQNGVDENIKSDGTTFSIGNVFGFFDGNVYEVILFTSTLSDLQRQKLEKNQGRYFNLSVA